MVNHLELCIHSLVQDRVRIIPLEIRAGNRDVHESVIGMRELKIGAVTVLQNLERCFESHDHWPRSAPCG